jgi:hypothetical protein
MGLLLTFDKGAAIEAGFIFSFHSKMGLGGGFTKHRLNKRCLAAAHFSLRLPFAKARFAQYRHKLK